MNDSPSVPPAKSRRVLKAVLLLIGVFLLGNITGAGGITLVMLKRLQADFRNPASSEGVGSRFLNWVGRELDKELDLNAEQREAVGEELAVTREKLRDIRVGTAREMRGLARDTVERISHRLPADKREQLRARVRERLRPWGVEPVDGP